MVIISDKVGQLANRLFQFSYVIANSIENNYRVINLNFDEYSEFFESSSKSNFEKFKINTVLIYGIPSIDYFIQKVISKFSNFAIRKNFQKLLFLENLYIDNKRFDLNDNYFQKIVKSKIVIIGGAWYYDYHNFIKHSEKIRSFFKPVHDFNEKIELLYQELTEENSILIGVHIRKGDYKEFMNGEHYLENGIYAERMEQAQILLSKFNKNIKFLLCSNEIIDLNDFKNLKVFYRPNHFIVDLYLLAKCDYIMGPLSTFSMWASFYGKTPLWQITKEKINLKQSDFQIKEYC